MGRLTMEVDAYRQMYELEDRHWWYQGLHQLVFASIDQLAHHGATRSTPLVILDAGCGTGSILNRLRRYGTAFGVDLSRVALTYCRSRGLSALAQASVLSLPFKDEAFDLVISTDVLYHRGVEDDAQALQEFYRVLRPHGALIVNVPAHERLRRAHDRQMHSRHRYSRQELESKLSGSRFQVAKITYRNMALLPAMLMVRELQKDAEDSGGGDLKAMSAPLNAFLRGYLSVENSLLRYVDLPFGTSVFCVAMKGGWDPSANGVR